MKYLVTFSDGMEELYEELDHEYLKERAGNDGWYVCEELPQEPKEWEQHDWTLPELPQ